MASTKIELLEDRLIINDGSQEISWKAICSEQLKGVIYFPVDKALLVGSTGETCSPEVVVKDSTVTMMKAPYEAKAPELEMKQSCLLITKHIVVLQGHGPLYGHAVDLVV
ncbi:hypothetical protein C5167_022463 [Papaver somniferum]|uniref:Uncharacterized protein n=1 Tax=Papaver somniferum TaxID=3469 RepID=A0A4Y7JLT9_PAPSO|nr:hypothetical protein C5167_022463 [Papaver somniferum]